MKLEYQALSWRFEVQCLSSRMHDTVTVLELIPDGNFITSAAKYQHYNYKHATRDSK